MGQCEAVPQGTEPSKSVSPALHILCTEFCYAIKTPEAKLCFLLGPQSSFPCRSQLHMEASLCLKATSDGSSPGSMLGAVRSKLSRGAKTLLRIQTALHSLLGIFCPGGPAEMEHEPHRTVSLGNRAGAIYRHRWPALFGARFCPR